METREILVPYNGVTYPVKVSINNEQINAQVTAEIAGRRVMFIPNDLDQLQQVGGQGLDRGLIAAIANRLLKGDV